MKFKLDENLGGAVAIGGLRVALVGDGLSPDPALAAFGVPAGTPADCTLDVQCAAPPAPPRQRPGARGDLWRLWRDDSPGRVFDERWCLATYGRGARQPPDRVLRCDAILTRGKLFLHPDAPDPNALAYPLDQILWLHLLARHGGVLLHACGLALADHGILLAGHSGAGKSTCARLWLREGDATLLNDDRVIVRSAADGTLCLWSTPWHGDVATVTPAVVPLAGVFVLRHGPTTRVRRLRPGEAAAALFARAFLPLWEKRAVAQTLALLDLLATSMPCYELAFTPDASACAAVRRCLR